MIHCLVILGRSMDLAQIYHANSTSHDKQCPLTPALCQLLCQIAEVLCGYQISARETRKLFLKLQASKTHLVSQIMPLASHTPTPLQENLSGLLYSIAYTASQNSNPSAFVSFSYPHPTNSLDQHHFLTVPNHTSWDAKSKAISMWICVSKYPLQVM